VKSELKGKTLNVNVSFAPGSGEESGRIWWIFDRAPDGSPDYISEMIPENQTMEMEKIGNQWCATIKLEPKAKRIDFFSNHRKTLRYKESPYRTYMSSPYTRVNLK
jgi:hypothetical protein